MYRTLLVLLLFSSPLLAGRLMPVLTHVPDRLPQVAFEQAQDTYYGQVHFVPNISAYHGIRMEEVRTIIDTHDYGICHFDGWFDSDGIHVGSDTFSVDTIRRQDYPGELFACKQNNAGDWVIIWSGRCANVIKNHDGTVTVVLENIKAKLAPSCTPKVKRVVDRTVQSVSGISVGDIYIGSESRVIEGTFYYTQECKE